MISFRGLILAATLASANSLSAQQPTEAPAPIERSDPAVDTASQWIGRALYLRCFCADNNLTFDATGHLEGQPKTTDWTLAAFTLQKVERRSPGEIELDGVRAAIRYATDRHEFDRHNQNDDKMKIIVADNGDLAALDRTLHSIFAEGLERSLQLAMPLYWQHYFNPNQPWPQDDLVGQQVANISAASAAATPAVVAHRAQASYTAAASRDHVNGTVSMRAVVDTEGTARRIAIVLPIGYGLDEHAVDAAAKIRFAPAVLNGHPVASLITLNEEFAVVGTP